MSSTTKIEQLVEWLDEINHENILYQGGYPPVVCDVPGYVIVASVDDCDRPRLEVYSYSQAIAWHDAIVAELAAMEEAGEDRDLFEAVNDTTPENQVNGKF